MRRNEPALSLVTNSHSKLWIYCLGPAVAMLLGWGLRGFIGGGPLGAMIPGAMVALLLCLILGLDQRASALLAAFGSIGIGLGGQMTYGQTIGLIVQPETFFWGLLGLSVKGGIWRLSGGAILGLGFVLKQIQRKDVVIGLVVLLAGLLVGWKLINEPRLIYFSNPYDKPRAEIWAGLLFGTMALLGYLALKGHAKLPLHFALWGALGGAIGFGGGGLWMVVGKTFPAGKQWLSWWKFMEFTFGFCFGLALGYAAWLKRATIWSAQASSPASGLRLPAVALSLVATTVMGLALLWLEASVDIVCTFTFLGVGLLIVALFREAFAWQIALTMTACAFVYDLVEKFSEETGWGDPCAKWIAAAVTAVLLGVVVALRLRSGKPMTAWAFLTLMWLAVVVSYLKSLRNFLPLGGHSIVELIFTVSAVVLTWLVVKKVQHGNSGNETVGA